jgi:hypothetical protein
MFCVDPYRPHFSAADVFTVHPFLPIYIIICLYDQTVSWQVLCELKSMEGLLMKQQEDMSQILGIVTYLKYKARMENIEGAYRALLKGRHKQIETQVCCPESYSNFGYTLPTLPSLWRLGSGFIHYHIICRARGCQQVRYFVAILLFDRYANHALPLSLF